MKCWYAVQCKAREDARAELNLRNQGYYILRPLARVRRRRQGRLTAGIESLFPRYLFVRLDDCTENWAPIRSTRGVAGLVRFGERPAPVPDSVIELLGQRLEAGDGYVDLTGEAEFRPDERVTITEGPFAGHQALFQARQGEDRILVLLEIMQRSQRLTLPETAVSRA